MSFDWDDPADLDPVSVMIFGRPKSGKTHWATFTMPPPVYIADTENRAGLVVKKARAAGIGVHWSRCSNLADVRAVAAEVLRTAEGDAPGTFVFDSASDLLLWAEEEFLKESRSDKIYPKVVWAKVYRKVDKIITALQQRGFFVVFLCREKEEYANDEKTGAIIHEGYKRLPYKSDVVMRHRGKYLKVYASALARTFPAKVDADTVWADLYKILCDGDSNAD